MKLINKWALTTSIAFCSLSASAMAEPLKISPNTKITTIDHCINAAPHDNNQLQIVVCNSSGYPLRLAGFYPRGTLIGNRVKDTWPLTDILPTGDTHSNFTPITGENNFAYAASYEIGDTGKYVQFAVRVSPDGQGSVNLCALRGASNSIECLESMRSYYDGKVKKVDLGEVSAFAAMPRNHLSPEIQWVFFVRE